VIAPAVGGTAEAVVPGKTGLVVPARAPAPLADAILALAADPAVRAELGITGRKLARETYGLDACVQRYERLYLALIGPHVGAIQSAIDDETAFLRPPTSASH
jgi:glycosyltransferase involved in cell wall biosynthesis